MNEHGYFRPIFMVCYSVLFTFSRSYGLFFFFCRPYLIFNCSPFMRMRVFNKIPRVLCYITASSIRWVAKTSALQAFQFQTHAPGAVMSARKKLMEEIYDQFLVCKICCDVYSRPKTLSCLHTFCETCIAKQHDAERQRAYRWDCLLSTWVRSFLTAHQHIIRLFRAIEVITEIKTNISN